jgi:hypothetical protein
MAGGITQRPSGISFGSGAGGGGNAALIQSILGQSNAGGGGNPNPYLNFLQSPGGSSIVSGVLGGFGNMADRQQQEEQFAQQQQNWQKQFGQSQTQDYLSAAPLGWSQNFQGSQALKAAILAQQQKGGYQPTNAGIAEHMPQNQLDLSQFGDPYGQDATLAAIQEHQGQLNNFNPLNSAIQFSGNGQKLAGQGGGVGGALNTGMTALNLYKQFGGKIPSFGNAPAAGAATGAGGAAQAVGGLKGAITGGTGSMYGAASKGLGASLKAGGIGGILGGFDTAMAIKNGQKTRATISGAMTGLKYGGPIGAGIGAGVGLVGAAIAGHQNATKGDREKFAKQMGYNDLASFNNYLSTLGPQGQALRSYGEGVVGKHDSAGNAKWLAQAQQLMNSARQPQAHLW